MRLDVTYTDISVEREIVRQAQQRLKLKFSASGKNEQSAQFSLDTIREARRQVSEVEVSDATLDYIMKIIDVTREAYKYRQIAEYLVAPVGPRASIGIAQAAQANAWLNGRSEITGEDVDYVVRDVLRHRLKLTKEAITQNYSADNLLNQILEMARQQ
jgi:MoxR-like ATPase